jgi:hypothetical protein
MNVRRRLTVPLLVVAVAATASPVATARPHKPKPKPKLDACKLLKRSDASSALGTPIDKVKGGQSATGARYCNWISTSGTFPKTLSLIVATTFAHKRFLSYKALLSSPSPVAGLGDEAAFADRTLIARKGRVFVDLAGNNVSVDVLKALALKVFSHLK